MTKTKMYLKRGYRKMHWYSRLYLVGPYLTRPKLARPYLVKAKNAIWSFRSKIWPRLPILKN